jgi:hypothetical protein
MDGWFNRLRLRLRSTTMTMKAIVALVALTQLATGVFGGDNGDGPGPSMSRIDEADLERNPELLEGLTNRGLYSSSSSSSSYSDAYGYNFFTDTYEAEYDGYQQAWRYLGWYVACGTPSDRYNDNSGSHDSNDGGGWEGSNYCQRYLMWAGVRTVSLCDVLLLYFRVLISFLPSLLLQHYYSSTST